MNRENILHKIRTALGRSAAQAPAPAPPVRLRPPEVPLEERLRRFAAALEEVGGKSACVDSPAAARTRVEELLNGRRAVASAVPFLEECGIHTLAGVCKAPAAAAELKKVCSEVEAGITSAEYALADTGSLVLMAGGGEARMVSLLPPAHIALVRRGRVLTGLDELFTLMPQPAVHSSSMVLVTGPSRTADIEQILIRGVHGPGEVYVIVV